LLFFANAVDAFLTYMGVTAGKIKEANPLMKNVVNDPILLFAVKILLPFTVIFIVLGFCTERSKDFSQITVFLLNAAIIIYASVLFLHAYWLFITS